MKGFTEHIDPDAIDADRVRRALAESGVGAASIAAHNEFHTTEGRQRHGRVLELCHELEVPFLNSYPGRPKSPEEIEEMLAGVRGVADRAQALGVRLCLENDGEYAPTGQVASDVLALIDHPWVQIVYDPANSVYFGGADPIEDVDYVLGSTGFLHLKDQRGGKDANDFPPIGEGELDLAPVLAKLEQAGYEGPVCVEIEYQGSGTWPDLAGCIDGARRSRERAAELLQGVVAT